MSKVTYSWPDVEGASHHSACLNSDPVHAGTMCPIRIGPTDSELLRQAVEDMQFLERMASRLPPTRGTESYLRRLVIDTCRKNLAQPRIQEVMKEGKS